MICYEEFDLLKIFLNRAKAAAPQFADVDVEKTPSPPKDKNDVDYDPADEEHDGELEGIIFSILISHLHLWRILLQS